MSYHFYSLCNYDSYHFILFFLISIFSPNTTLSYSINSFLQWPSLNIPHPEFLTPTSSHSSPGISLLCYNPVRCNLLVLPPMSLSSSVSHNSSFNCSLRIRPTPIVSLLCHHLILPIPHSYVFILFYLTLWSLISMSPSNSPSPYIPSLLCLHPILPHLTALHTYVSILFYLTLQLLNSMCSFYST